MVGSFVKTLGAHMKNSMVVITRFVLEPPNHNPMTQIRSTNIELICVATGRIGNQRLGF
jgi:hypothetical protein